MNENNSKIQKIKKSGHTALILVRIAKIFSIAMSVVMAPAMYCDIAPLADVE